MTDCPKGKEPLRNSDPFVTVLLKLIVLKKINDVGVANTGKILLGLALLDRVLHGLLDVVRDSLETAEVAHLVVADVMDPEGERILSLREVAVEPAVLVNIGKHLKLVFALIS